MAIVNKNVAIEGLSGMIGRALVYRQLAGRTVVSAAPQPPSVPASGKQENHRNRFRNAIQYANAQKLDPPLYAAYAAAGKHRHLTAYNVALADFMNSPVIHEIDLSSFHDQHGDKVNIKATDDFLLVSVEVSIFKPDGTLLETGYAQQTGNPDEWQYIISVSELLITGYYVIIEAQDLPGNKTIRKQQL